MDITLFCVLLGLSIALVVSGLFREDHTELSLVGFVFLFLLSILIINNQLEYKTGSYTNITQTYDNATGSYLLNASYEIQADIYKPANYTGVTSHLIGYWLAVCSVIGFIAVILSLRADPQVTGRRKEEDF